MANILLEEFLDDMAEQVGLKLWAKLTAIFGILAYSLHTIDRWFLAEVALWIMTANVAGALLVAAYHKYWRRRRRSW